jgi:hypothetical protein
MPPLPPVPWPLINANQAIYVRLLILFCALNMVQQIKLFKITVEVCDPQ